MIDEIENNYSGCYMESRRGVQDTTSTISHVLAVVSMGIIMALGYKVACIHPNISHMKSVVLRDLGNSFKI